MTAENCIEAAAQHMARAALAGGAVALAVMVLALSLLGPVQTPDPVIPAALVTYAVVIRAVYLPLLRLGRPGAAARQNGGAVPRASLTCRAIERACRALPYTQAVDRPAVPEPEHAPSGEDRAGLSDGRTREPRALPSEARARATGPEPSQDLVLAIERGEIEAGFRPHTDPQSGRLISIGVSIRWRHPRLGVLDPGAAPMTDCPDLAGALSHVALGQGLAALAGWRRRGFSVPDISLSVHLVALSAPGFADHVLFDLDRHDLAPGDLAISPADFGDGSGLPQAAAATLDRLIGAGIRIRPPPEPAQRSVRGNGLSADPATAWLNTHQPGAFRLRQTA